jgi:hypothetical protein
VSKNKINWGSSDTNQFMNHDLWPMWIGNGDWEVVQTIRV